MFNNEFGAKVDRMKSVYRGNPEKLKQSSGINADLSKLMAYQSMISERQALENEAVLRREQQPSSLVEQYENKLVQGNVDNMKSRAARVGGIPQNLQQPPMAQGAPQGAAQGIASQPRPNMQGMAQGGIVGYREGGLTSISDAEVVAFLKKKYGQNLTGRQLESILNNPERIASEKESMMQDAARARVAEEIPRTNRSDAEVVAFIKKKYGQNLTGKQLESILNNPERIASEKESMVQEDERGKVAARRARTEELIGMPTVEKPSGTGGIDNIKATIETTQAPAGGLIGLTPGAGVDNVAATIADIGNSPAPAATAAAPTPATDPTTGGVATLPVGTGTVLKADPEEGVADPKEVAKTPAEKAAALDAAKKTYKGKSPTQAALDEFGIPSVLTDVKRSTETPIADGLGKGVVDAKKAQAAGDPTAQGATERARLTKDREALGIDVEYQRQIDAQKALDAKATDPAARKKADRDAILRGMALGGVRGSTIAQNRLAANRSEGEQTRLDRMSKMNTDKNTAKFEMLKDIDSRAAEAYSMYAKVQTDAFNSLVGLSEAELGNMEENFKNNVLYKQGEIENVLTAANLTVANTMKEIAQGSLDLNRTIQAQISATNTLGTISKEMRTSQALERQNAEIKALDTDPEIKRAGEEKLAALDNDILVAQSDMLQLVETLTARIAKLQ